MAHDDQGEAVIELRGVQVHRGGRTILGPLDWTVRRAERWVVVGPNGAGKTTLIEIASTMLWPSRGSVSILGRAIGTVDTRTLRTAIGYAGSGLERRIADGLTALEVVMTARHAALGPWWHAYDDADRARAAALLDRVGLSDLRDTPFGVLSTGERRRVQVARALMPDPALLLLDEPAAGLDLGARESLVDTLDAFAADPALAAIVLVSHHLEEIPASFDRALVLARGAVIAADTVELALADEPLSAAYGRPLRVLREGGRVRAVGATTGAAGWGHARS